MMRLAILLLLCVAVAGPSGARAEDAAPRLQVRASLDGAVVAGGTVRLTLDVMTSTWFVQPPQLPALTLPGVLVTPPGGQARIVRGEADGVALNGLQYVYVLSPTQAGEFTIPALTVTAGLGQASAPLTASSAPLTLRVGAAAGTGVVAQTLHATQSFTPSAQPLPQGGRIRRSVTLRADGAQAMLIPPTVFGDIAGLRRYPREAEVRNLTDGHGGFNGGERTDSVDYVAERAGTVTLPPLNVQWRDAAGQPRTLTLAGASFEVTAAPARADPFPLASAPQAGAGGLHAPRAWLHAGAAGLLLALAAWLGWPALRRAAMGLRAATRRRLARWRASERYAWGRLRHALRGQAPDRYGALYRWLARAGAFGSLRQAAAAVNDTAAGDQILAAEFGPRPDPAGALALLRAQTPRWRRAWRRHAAPTPALPDLNPAAAPAPGDRS